MLGLTGAQGAQGARGAVGGMGVQGARIPPGVKKTPRTARNRASFPSTKPSTTNIHNAGSWTPPLQRSLIPSKSSMIEGFSTGPEAQPCTALTCPQGFSTQPEPTICTDMDGCVGDDTFHKVCPQAYTWPNDPQTYDCDAREYNITFCPGGTPIKMADSKSGIPSCSALAAYPEYNYQKALNDCSGSINNGNLYVCQEN
jgi:hypothetical protein